ncbi:MAG: alpha/beta hydrolase, partial [Bdellovibrionales bacterium]
MSATPKSTGYFDSFDGTEIYYEVRGKGEPIVFVYGIGCLMNHWNPQIKYFSEHHKTVIFDYRAHNKSGKPEDDKNFTLESFAKDIQGLLEFLKIDSAHFVGHSFAAQVLCKTYDLYPGLFKSMTFVNGFVSNPIRGMFGSDLPTKAFETVKSGFELLPNAITKVWQFSVSNPIAVPLSALAGGFNLSLTNYKDIEIYAKALSHIDLKYFIDLFEQMMTYDGTDVLSRIKCPVLI